MLARNIHDEDTIELQLSAAELERLTQAAAQAIDPPAETTLLVETVPQAAAPVAAVVSKASSEPEPAQQSVAPAVVPQSTAPTIIPAPELIPVHEPPPGLRVVSPPRSTRDKYPRRRAFRLPAAAAVLAIAVLLALLYVPTYWPTSLPSSVPQPAAHPAVAIPPAPISTAAPGTPATPRNATWPPAAPKVNTPPASEPAPPVRFRNPFDPSEVFEFPAGTSYAEARERVARVLMARAQERHGARARVAQRL